MSAGEYFTQADLWATAAGTVSKLSAALEEEFRLGRVSSAAQAFRFVKTWADALEAARPQVPIEAKPAPLAYREGGVVSPAAWRERKH